MRLWYVRVIVGILAAVVMSACGSSKKASSAATTPSTATTPPVTSISSPTTATALEPAFIARVNTVCARGKARLDAYGQFPYQTFDPLHPDVKLLPKIAAFFALHKAIADRVPVELRDLGTPQKGQALWSQMVALAQQSREIADRQIAAAKASDAARFVATVNEVSATDARLQKLGVDGGFSPSSPCTAIL